jgi:hypothetical protein
LAAKATLDEGYVNKIARFTQTVWLPPSADRVRDGQGGLSMRHRERSAADFLPASERHPLRLPTLESGSALRHTLRRARIQRYMSRNEAKAGAPVHTGSPAAVRPLNSCEKPSFCDSR